MSFLQVWSSQKHILCNRYLSNFPISNCALIFEIENWTWENFKEFGHFSSSGEGEGVESNRFVVESPKNMIEV